MEKTFISSLVLLLIIGCSTSPKRSSKENEIALKRIMQSDGFPGVERYFGKYSYKDTTREERVVINLENGEYSLEELNEQHQKDVSHLNECLQSSEVDFLKKCVSEFRSNVPLLTHKQWRDSQMLEVKLSKLSNKGHADFQVKSPSKVLSNEDKEKLREEHRKLGCITLNQIRDITWEKQSHYIADVPCFGRASKNGECNLFQGVLYKDWTPVSLITNSIEPLKEDRIAWFVRQEGKRQLRLKDGRLISIPIFKESERCKKIVYSI